VGSVPTAGAEKPRGEWALRGLEAAGGLPAQCGAGLPRAARADAEQRAGQVPESVIVQKCHYLVTECHLPSELPPLPCSVLVVSHYSKLQVTKHD